MVGQLTSVSIVIDYEQVLKHRYFECLVMNETLITQSDEIIGQLKFRKCHSGKLNRSFHFSHQSKCNNDTALTRGIVVFHGDVARFTGNIIPYS